jgi:hypothetical protein
VYKNGDKYEGDWALGFRHGLGTLWVFRGSKYMVKYNGEWNNDMPEVIRDNASSSAKGKALKYKVYMFQ